MAPYDLYMRWKELFNFAGGFVSTDEYREGWGKKDTESRLKFFDGLYVGRKASQELM